VSVRRPGLDVAARSLRTEYVAGNYFTTFGIGAFGGRAFTADDDTPASPPVAVRGSQRAVAAVIESTWIVLVLTSSVPLTVTFFAANFAGVRWSLSA
jgi:hypothetical protein